MNFKTAVVQLVTVSLLIFANFELVGAQHDSVYRLPVGTRIRLKMDVELSSRVAAVSDTFTATVAKAVTVRDVVVLPAGSVVNGRVASVYNLVSDCASFGLRLEAAQQIIDNMVDVVKGWRVAKT